MRNLPTEEEIISKWKGSAIHPIVSICCLTYNHEEFIEDALEGFLKQETDFAYEVLVHDDASKDNTQTIIRIYEKAYPKILKVIYQNENQLSNGINVGVEYNLTRAKGKYIALCEGDDFWVDPKKIQIQKNFLERESEYVICYTDIIPFDNKGLIEKDFGGAKKDLSQEELKRGASLFTPTTFFRNILPKWPLELNNAKYGDLCIWSQLGDYGKGKYLNNVKPSMYRVHGNGIHSMAGRKKQIQMRLETMMALYSFRLKKGDQAIADYHLEEVFVLIIKIFKAKILFLLTRRLVLSLVTKIRKFIYS